MATRNQIIEQAEAVLSAGFYQTVLKHITPSSYPTTTQAAFNLYSAALILADMADETAVAAVLTQRGNLERAAKGSITNPITWAVRLALLSLIQFEDMNNEVVSMADSILSSCGIYEDFQHVNGQDLETLAGALEGLCVFVASKTTVTE